MKGMETPAKPATQPEEAQPSSEAGQSAPQVPPASETWVEGQPTSDADYGGEDKPTE
jgi:hypothetical protein